MSYKNVCNSRKSTIQCRFYTINRLTKFLYCLCQWKIQIQNILSNVYSRLLQTVYLFERKYLGEWVINVFSFPMRARFFSETNIMARRNRSLSATSITSETCQNCIAHYLRERGISKNALTFKRRIVEEKRSTRRRSALGLAAAMVCYLNTIQGFQAVFCSILNSL